MQGSGVEVSVERLGLVGYLRCSRGPEATLQSSPVRAAAAQTRKLHRQLPERSGAAGICSHAPRFCFRSAPPSLSPALGVLPATGPAPLQVLLPLGKACFRFCSMAARQTLRVLCLAGFRQSERGFREKTGALRKALRGRAELVCLSGPHPVPEAAAPEGAGTDSGEIS